LYPKSDQNKIERSNNAKDYLGKKNEVRKKFYTRIVGSYNKVFSLLSEKIKRRYPNFACNCLLIFDSFNRVNYLETAEGKIDLLSFSSTIANKDLLTNSDYPASYLSSILI
jgi:hypothetical protein